LKLKYDEALSKFAFNCSLRHYTLEMQWITFVVFNIGRAVQVDPGFSQLTPRLLSALETKT